MKIGIFCSANDTIDPDFFKLTTELGEWMGQNGHQLVYGGCGLGLMACVGRAVHNAGGCTIGMIPRIIEKGGRTSDDVDVEVPCNDLSDRKELMLAQSDIMIALPGGIGTLDEIFTVAASCTIGYHHKKVILYNMKGFWTPAIVLLDDLQSHGFIRGKWTDYILVANNFEELKHLISIY